MSEGKGSDAKCVTERCADQHAVWDYLGVNYRKILDFVDGYMQSDRHMVSVLANILSEFKPNMVFTHYPKDRHQDHRAVANAVISACGINTSLAFFDSYSSDGFVPRLYVGIVGHVEKKKYALNLFGSEVEKFAARGIDFSDVAIVRNMKYGNNIGKYAAEGYRLAKHVIC